MEGVETADQQKAENLKKGYFSQEIVLAEDDPSVGVIQNASNQFLARASQEITRSIVTYKRLKKGKSPQKIFLTGRGALLPNLAFCLRPCSCKGGAEAVRKGCRMFWRSCHL